MEFKVPSTPPSVRRELRRASKKKQNNYLHYDGCKLIGHESPFYEIEFDIPHLLRMQAIEEFVNSEKIYMCKLNSLMKFFCNPLKEHTIISETIHFKLFGQIEMIYNLNAGFLKELEENIMDVGKAFLKITPFFNLYSLYAFNHKFSIYTLHTLTNQHPAFRSFLREKESRPEVVAKLNILLYAPVQRMQQYKLLLQKIMDNTSETEAEHKLIQESIDAIKVPCFHAECMIPGRDAQQLLINLQNSLFNRYPNIVKPDRTIVFEGVLSIISKNGRLTDCYCVLMSDIFMCCKILKQRAQNTLVENSLDCYFIYPIDDCQVFDQFSGSFEICCQDDKNTFWSRNHEAGLTWIWALTKAFNPLAVGKKEKLWEPMRAYDLFENFQSECRLSPNQPSNEYKNVYRNQNMASIDDDDPHSETWNLRRNENYLFKPPTSIMFGSNGHEDDLLENIDDKENSTEDLISNKRVKLESLAQMWYMRDERE